MRLKTKSNEESKTVREYGYSVSESKAFKPRTLGIDHSLTSTGISIVGVTDEGEPILLYSEEIRTSSKDSFGERLTKIAEGIVDVIRLYEPEYIVREQSIVKHWTATQAIFRVVGVIDLVVSKYLEDGEDITEAPITAVKRKITGDGSADKLDMDESVRYILQIEDESFFRTKRGRLQDDVVDSIGIALYELDKRKAIKLK